MPGVVISVGRHGGHALAKPPCGAIRLLEGLGVEGDAHAGATVRHRSDRRWNPQLPNLRQVHLLGGELLDELQARGFDVHEGQMGENVLTRDVDLLGLPAGARLHLGAQAAVEVTGLRSPCVQLDRFRPGLMDATLARDEDGGLVRRAGVMGVVAADGEVRPGDPVRVQLPGEPHHRALAPV
ncbi:MAG TPA: MOSC domain-containing protein [Solirubrobacteraceae bacterium]|nr:MOSC domain-containing protein [Solirubrobacteraceae bacterium]